MIVPIALLVRLFMPSSMLPALAFSLVAFVWQCSPLKQRCLNRGHAHPELAAFGVTADFDALRFGITHGVWCAGSCWALMLWPELFPVGHVTAMAVVTLWLLAERLDRPTPPRWRLRTTSKALRLVIAQTRTLLSIG
jgi:predicted metal-binding membrane protein